MDRKLSSEVITRSPARLDSPDQSHHLLVLHPACHSCHQHVVVHPVEETLQIQIHHPIIPGQDVFLGALYRLMRAAFRTKAIAVVRKRRVEEWLQDLQHRLLNHPVHHRRDT
ncbi:uncharacterized protein METZ01_LOCUS206161, partial [marine metagenome]